MKDIFRPALDYLTEQGPALVRVAVILLVAGLVVRTARFLVQRRLAARLAPGKVALGRVLVTYGTWLAALLWSLRLLGFDLGVLLGAAGVVTVAVGFASQTSMSNAISGLFLLVERPFSIGDIIDIEGVTGTVHSIDLMSIKLRLFDNRFVRVPTKSVLELRVTSLTRFPIRRADFDLVVPFEADLDRVRDLLVRNVGEDHRVLEDPAPYYLVRGFGDRGVEVRISAWLVREGFFEVRTDLYHRIKRVLDAEGISMAVPQRVLRPGPEPLAVRTTYGEP